MDNQVNFCPHCGTRLIEGDRRCRSCGEDPWKDDGRKPDGYSDPVTVHTSQDTRYQNPQYQDTRYQEARIAYVLPDPTLPPRLGRGLSAGWDLLMANFGNAILITLIYAVVSAVVVFIPIL